MMALEAQALLFNREIMLQPLEEILVRVLRQVILNYLLKEDILTNVKEQGNI